MRITYLVILSSGLLFWPTGLRGQPTLLSVDENASFVGGNLQGATGASSYGVLAGFGARGLLHFSLGLNRLDSSLMGLDGTVVSPTLTITPLRLPNAPLGLVASAAYSWQSFSSALLDSLGIKLRSGILSFGGGVFAELPLSPKARLVPVVTLNYISTTSKIIDQFNSSASFTASVFGFGAAAGLRINTSPKSYIFIQPGLLHASGSTTYMINAGFGFSRSGKIAQEDEWLAKDRFIDESTAVTLQTRLPNFRRVRPEYDKYSDDKILKALRKKYPQLQAKRDDELVQMIEGKYGKQQ